MSFDAGCKNFSFFARCCIHIGALQYYQVATSFKKIFEKNLFLQKQILFQENLLDLKDFVEHLRNIIHALGLY